MIPGFIIYLFGILTSFFLFHSIIMLHHISVFIHICHMFQDFQDWLTCATPDVEYAILYSNIPLLSIIYSHRSTKYVYPNHLVHLSIHHTGTHTQLIPYHDYSRWINHLRQMNSEIYSSLNSIRTLYYCIHGKLCL